VLGLRERLYGPVHTRVARSLALLATALRDVGDCEDAARRVRRALTIQQKLLGEEHPETAATHRLLGTVLQEQGDLAAAALEYQQALDVQRRKLPPQHPTIASTLTYQATLAAARNELTECEELAREALRLLETSNGVAWRLAEAESVLGECLAGQGRNDDAEPLLHRGFFRLRALRGEHAPRSRAAAARLSKFKRQAE
jgi:tetratricopeptide (TPR) repeat protein